MSTPFVRRRIVQADALGDQLRIPSGRVEDIARERQVVPETYALKRRQARRSSELVRAVAQLDLTTDPQTLRELMAWVDEQYKEREGGTLLGLFGKCYLGHPFVDHRMSLERGILDHYSPADTVPAAFTAARPFARSAAYRYIEVYGDGSIIPIRDDGTQAV